MDLKRGKWEILGGQTWSWLTPNREGIGPIPSDLAITYNDDQNLASEFLIRELPSSEWLITRTNTGPWEQVSKLLINLSAILSHSLRPSLPLVRSLTMARRLVRQTPSQTFYPRSPTTNEFARRPFTPEFTGLFTGAHASAMPLGSNSFKTRTTVGGGGQIAAKL